MGPPVEPRRRVGEHQHVGPLEERPREPDLLARDGPEAPAPDPDLVVEPRLDHRGPEPEVFDHLRHEALDALRRPRLPVGDLAEQDVVLDGGGRVVALRVEELDAAPERRRQLFGEAPPRGEQTPPQRLVHDPEAMARRLEQERQRQEPTAVLLPEPVDPVLGGAVDHRLELREVVRVDEAEPLERRMAVRQPGEELEHRGGDGAPRLEQGRHEPLRLQHPHDPGVLGEPVHVEPAAHRGPEQEVLADGGVLVVAVGVEALDEGGDGRVREPFAERAPRPEQPFPKLPLGIDGAAQPEIEYVPVELHRLQRLEEPRQRVAAAQRLAVDPVAVHVVGRVPGDRRLRRPRRVRPRRAGGGLVLEAIEQVVAHRRVEQERLRADVGEPPAGHPLVQAVGPLAADGERARGGVHQPGEHEGQLLAPAPRRADHRHLRVGGDGERHAFEEARAGVVPEGEAGGRELARHPGARGRGAELERFVEHPRGAELGDHLLVLDPRVLAALVVVEELLPGRGEVLVGRDRGHQGPDLQPAQDHEVPADGVEAERPEVVDGVVQELDDELPDEDAEAHRVDLAEGGGHGGALVSGGVVAADLLDPGHGLPDAVGEPAHEPHPLLGERVHPALELRDDVELERIEGDRGGRHHPVLHQQEGEDDEEVAPLEDGQLERVADEPAERLHLGRDHGDDLALGELAEVRQGEAQNAAVEVVAQAPEHALAGPPREHVDRVLEPLVGDHEEEEPAAEEEQVFELGERGPEHDGREVVRAALDHPVHDLLRELVERIEEREGRDREHGQHHLRAQGVPDDVAVDRVFHFRG